MFPPQTKRKQLNALYSTTSVTPLQRYQPCKVFALNANLYIIVDIILLETRTKHVSSDPVGFQHAHIHRIAVLLSSVICFNKYLWIKQLCVCVISRDRWGKVIDYTVIFVFVYSQSSFSDRVGNAIYRRSGLSLACFLILSKIVVYHWSSREMLS